MKFSFPTWFISKVSQWLTKDSPPERAYMCNFERICEEIKPGDVLLVEGRNRISRVIKQITQSPWSHAALYIGRLHSITNKATRELIKKHTTLPPETQLIIESVLGKGTIIRPLTHYHQDHLRICRPQGLAPKDAQKVIDHAVTHLGTKYSKRHIFDLARFLMPWNLYPRHWRSTLFSYSASKPTEEICSYMIAEAFASVRFPILPLVTETEAHELKLIRRNPRLFTPSDFDYSPYFAIIKYPIFPLGEEALYRNLPWSDEQVVSSDKMGIRPIIAELQKKQSPTEKDKDKKEGDEDKPTEADKDSFG